MTRKSAGTPIRIWALLGARAGDNDQVIAVAELLGLPFEIKQLEYNHLRRLGPRLLGRSLASLARRSRQIIAGEPAPDLTISVGHRSVPVARALRHRSHGHTRSIHIGFPRVSPGIFDLLITTPQYPVPDHPNVLRIPYAFTRAATTSLNPLDGEKSVALPAPRRLLIVGGPNLYWRIDEPLLLQTLAAMLDEGRKQNGSVLVTTSPRTPAPLQRALANMLEGADVPTLLTGPGGAPTLAQLLAAADSIRVTADSVAMVSDAIWTGKPVALVRIAMSRLGRTVLGIMDRVRASRPVHPQDLRFFWRELAAIGVTDRLSSPRGRTQEQVSRIRHRIEAVLD
ncbi:MAG: ELM1/GtrOC1 family putative glycosyltransferase [Rhizomicrobium sp.]